MTDPEHARPFELVPSLALDAALPLYPLLGVPKGDVGGALHPFLKQAVDYSGFAPRSHDLWKSVQDYAWATLPPQTAEALITWLGEAFTGYHPADTDLSGWLMVLDHFDTSQDLWESVGMDGQQSIACEAFVEYYIAQLDDEAFDAALDAAREAKPSSWDKRVLQAYEFVYSDRQSGADPFLILKFVHQGQTLRRAIKDYDFAAHPDFPHDLLRDAAQALIEQRHVWMPEGKVLGQLVALS